jgi:hypothetical protein
MAARNDHIRHAAISLMRKGLATPFEIAKASGRSRQICRHWGLDFAASREAYVKQLWTKTLGQASRFPEIPPVREKKRPLRKIVEEI